MVSLNWGWWRNHSASVCERKTANYSGAGPSPGPSRMHCGLKRTIGSLYDARGPKGEGALTPGPAFRSPRRLQTTSFVRARIHCRPRIPRKGQDMILDKEAARKEGFSDSEIDWMERYCSDKRKKGLFSNKAAAISIGKGPVKLVCETVAQAVNKLRPGAWIPIR